MANRRNADHKDRKKVSLLLGKLRGEVDALRAELAARGVDATEGASLALHLEWSV